MGLREKAVLDRRSMETGGSSILAAVFFGALLGPVGFHEKNHRLQARASCLKENGRRDKG